MSEYDNLSSVIGEMKRAAIDSFMSEQGWPPNIANDSWYSLWGFVAGNSYERPSKEGKGGGKPTGAFNMAGESMAPDFDGIRSTIDGIISPWLELPDGSACAAPQQSASSAAAVFGASGTAASMEDDGEIFTSSETISEVLINNIQGSFTTPFHNKYYSQFSKVSAGLGAACAILEMSYAAQSKIWPAAREDVATICVNTREALKADAGQNAQAYEKVVFTVIGAVAGLAASIATAGAALPTVITLVGLSTAATTAMAGIEATTTISGSSYSGILGSFENALTALSNSVKSQENALKEMLTSAANEIEGDPSSFDLDAFVVDSYPAADTLSMQRWNADMVSNNMTRVGSSLQSASSFLGSSPSANPTPRDNNIGIGSDGIHSYSQQLYDLTSRCISLTTAEYNRGQKLFEATVEDYFNADASATALVNSLAADERLTEPL